MSIDEFLGREYDRQTYNCLHFAAEVWMRLTGDDRLNMVDEQDFKAGKIASTFRDMKRVAGPTSTPSVALMETLEGDNHIGICWKRRLLHINTSGPQNLCLDAVSAQFKRMRFYQ